MDCRSFPARSAAGLLPPLDVKVDPFSAQDTRGML